ncbi:uncharacterized protein cubi_00139 [Cryptosporidium ubiquitum]|uniref:Uncharacterized protein n=1 Tax=Cryptosporidium ubiquitum TaxID=857276 RepID=A0A1J4MJZ3_9CRYT|nr:uncharacterized protein cubi_00139 [Cryptosporidium ubiquitum]OII74586.1 hypothetical protein cubi_00139 [Cryptosporidium ubiquitum]
MVLINRWAVFVYLLLLFLGSIKSEETQINLTTQVNNLDRYEFIADDLLSRNFPYHKFRDLKRRSRVIIEANNRMLHVFEDLLSISDEILESFSEPSKDSFFLESYKPISLVPNPLIKFLVDHVEKMLENLPSSKPISYYLDNEVIENYTRAHRELLNDYRVLSTRVACRLLITSILLSSLENIKNREHSIEIGISYPFLDDIVIPPKSTAKSNIAKVLNRILNSIRNFGRRIKIGIKRKVDMDDESELVNLESQESNEKEFISNIYNHRQSCNVSIFGRDKVVFENNQEVLQVIKNFIGKQERNSNTLLQILEKVVKEELGIENFKEIIWNIKTKSKLTRVCRNSHVLEILPKRMKLKTCIQLFNKVGEILTGFYYKDNEHSNLAGRINILKRIRRNSSLKFIQAILIYYNVNEKLLKDQVAKASMGTLNRSHRTRYPEILDSEQ